MSLESPLFLRSLITKNNPPNGLTFLLEFVTFVITIFDLWCLAVVKCLRGKLFKQFAPFCCIKYTTNYLIIKGLSNKYSHKTHSFIY